MLNNPILYDSNNTTISNVDNIIIATNICDIKSGGVNIPPINNVTKRNFSLWEVYQTIVSWSWDQTRNNKPKKKKKNNDVKLDQFNKKEKNWFIVGKYERLEYSLL